MEKPVYKLNFNCGRNGNLEGVFIAKKTHVKLLIENSFDVYFGEVFGRHSEVYGNIDDKELVMISDEPQVIKIVEDYKLSSGYNPFDCNAVDLEREEFVGLTILDICEILEKESLNK